MTQSKFWLIARVTLATTALGLVIGCAGGGGGGGNPPVIAADPNACPESGMPKLPAFCCDNGIRVKFDGDCAGPELAGVPPIAGAATAANTAREIAESSNKAAASLVCPAGTVVTAENKTVCAIATSRGNKDAATADSIAMAPPAAEPEEELAKVQKDAGPRGTGGSSGGGSMSGGSGFGSLFSGRTDASAPETRPSLVMNSGNAIAAPAGAGANKSGATEGGGLSWSTLGQTGRAPGGENGGTLDFGNTSANGVNPLGSADPEDYFTKLGLSESIFKVVEKRYRAKSMDWVTTDLSAGKSPLK